MEHDQLPAGCLARGRECSSCLNLPPAPAWRPLQGGRVLGPGTEDRLFPGHGAPGRANGARGGAGASNHWPGCARAAEEPGPRAAVVERWSAGSGPVPTQPT